jgi:hypothetical protein
MPFTASRNTPSNPRSNPRSGQALVEFAIVGIPAVFLSLTLFWLPVALWRYHTLAEVAQVTARYVTAHGYDCTQNGNTCSITLGNIASYVESQAVGLSKSSLNVKLTAASGDTTCNPVSSCDSSSTVYPSGSSDGAQGADIIVTVTYAVTNPIYLYWPGAGTIAPSSTTYTFSGKSRQRITF